MITVLYASLLSRNGVASTNAAKVILLRKVTRVLTPSKRRCPPQSQLITTTPIPAGQVDCIPVEL
jgi:hypothetical protein